MKKRKEIIYTNEEKLEALDKYVYELGTSCTPKALSVIKFIKKAKESSDSQISLDDINEEGKVFLRGYAINFPTEISIVDCLDLTYVNLKNPNAIDNMINYMFTENYDFCRWFEYIKNNYLEKKERKRK